MPTYEYKMYHPMRDIINHLISKHTRHKKIFRFGSFGWSGGAQKKFDRLTERMKWNCMDLLVFQGAPTNEGLERGYQMGKKLALEIKKKNSKKKFQKKLYKYTLL